MTKIKQKLCNIIDQSQSRTLCDLVIKNAKVFSLATGDMIKGDIAICDDTIIGIGEQYDGKEEIDADGLIATAGFIDSHLHIESSLLIPREFERCVLPHGTTTAICDPHELSNVLGKTAIEYFLDASKTMIMDLRVQLSSCVPASPLETSGGTISVEDIKSFMNDEKVIGLAEFMNFPRIFFKDETCLNKLELFYGKHIDGHSPLVRGKDLNTYCAVGIHNCHETTSLDEAREKINKGMTVLIREGSICKDTVALAKILDITTSPFLALCTDDRNPLDIAEEGHIDFIIKKLISLGVPPLAVYRSASYSAAKAFGLTDRGLIAPGYRADIVFVKSLENCDVQKVICDGRVIDDKIFETRKPFSKQDIGLNSVKLSNVLTCDFEIKDNKPETRVIGITEGSIITDDLKLNLEIKDGLKLPDIKQDVAKICVFARHGHNKNIGRGFVKGFGLNGGAIASTVGHDSHNLCVVSTNDDDMAVAVNYLIDNGGGFVCVKAGKVVSALALPVGGLMSNEDYHTVAEKLAVLRTGVKELGTKIEEPFLQLAFLPLSVIPHLKITDLGLVDVDKFEVIG